MGADSRKQRKTHPMTNATITTKHLKTIEQRLLLSHWMIHNANHLRPNDDGIKVGGHQASSASMVSIMTALYFSALRLEDRVAVKRHASPIFHAKRCIAFVHSVYGLCTQCDSRKRLV